jgi:AcrR family transcriptional regulator
VELTGRSKSTIYSYFSTKEEIFKTAVYLILDDMKDVIASEAMKSEDDMEQVYRSMLIKISVGIEGISIGFLEQIKQHFPEVWLIIEAFIGQVLTNLESIYRKGMQSGDFKRFNISLLTALDNHFVMSIMTNTAKFQGQGMSLNDLVTEYLELRLSALKK